MESIYQINQIVWAKVNGYPWWPGFIKSELKVNEFEVVFFGDFSRAMLNKAKIKEFEELSCKANAKNKLLVSAVRSAEAIINGESTIMDEWSQLDKSVLMKNQQSNKKPAKRPAKSRRKSSGAGSLSLKTRSKTKDQESMIKAGSEEQNEFKCSNSVNNNITSSTDNPFADIKASSEEVTPIEEKLEEFWLNLRSEEFRSETCIPIINEVANKIMNTDPKAVFNSNVGTLLSSCVNVCRVNKSEQHKQTLDVLSITLGVISDYIIKEGFLMENKVANDYVDISKRNSILHEIYPDLNSPGIFDITISPRAKKSLSDPVHLVETKAEEKAERKGLEVEQRIQFRVKKKLAKLIYSRENRGKLKKKVCENLATRVEHLIRQKSRSIEEYKDEVLGVVKAFDRDFNRTNEILLGFQNGKNPDLLMNDLNKLIYN